MSFNTTHLISAGFSVLLIVISAIGIAFYGLFKSGADYFNMPLDAETAPMLAVYIFGVYLIFNCEKAQRLESWALKSEQEQNSSGTWMKFLCCAVVLVFFAIALSGLGKQIAQIPVAGRDLGGTFVGSLFIAITTSLPEMAVGISAVKLGFLDMALSNIFGSNMFNMAIIPIMDLIVGSKHILSFASTQHLFTILFVVVLTALVLAGLGWRSKRRAYGLAWDSAALILIYLIANLFNFCLR